MIDPQGRSLTVSSAGGQGGAGGKGGKGGAGGSGGEGMPPGSDGFAGHDGQDGRAGSDGRPGLITVSYDPSAQPFLSALHEQGATMQETQVPALW